MDTFQTRRRQATRPGMCLGLLALALAGCQPEWHRREADTAAGSIIRSKQIEALGRSEDLKVDRPSDELRRRVLAAQSLAVSGQASRGTAALKPIAHWPQEVHPAPAGRQDVPVEPNAPGGPLELKLTDALQVAARGNRAYQAAKEDVFRAALAMDVEDVQFRSTFAGALQSVYTTDLGGRHTTGGLASSGLPEWQKQLKTGAAFSARLAVDLVKLMTLDRQSAFGILADATMTVPLLRGAGAHIVAEPLTQAERNVVYAIYALERFKRQLAVQTASEYLAVLQQGDQVKNNEDNYRRLKVNARRARRMADAGRLPEIQVGQALQDELRARDRWVASQQAYARRLDAFKLTLGLPTDARIELDRAELERLAAAARQAVGAAAIATMTTQPTQPTTAPAADEPVVIEPPSREGGGPLEMESDKAIAVAMARRVDLRIAHGRVYDAQRRVVIAADALKAGLTLVGTAEAGERRGLGSAGAGSVRLRPEHGVYAGGAIMDLPLERTAERDAYRDSFILLDRAVRSAQDLEDQVKLDVREALRALLQARESYSIQAQAVQLAQRRVTMTEVFLEAERAQVRDVLESQEALVSAQNALTAALVDYRVAELELQRDMGVLGIDEKGLWSEYRPDDNK